MSTTAGPGPSGTLAPASRVKRVVAVVAAAALGFGGAAVIDTFLLARPAIADADDYGPAGDGLTRFVVTAPGGITADGLAALQEVPGVDNAQVLFDGSALVAGDGITPAQLRAAVPGAEAELSVPGEVFGRSVSDPYWSQYGWNLANTGSNFYNQTGVAGADVDAPTGWRAGTGRGLTVAVTDTGVMSSHPDLAGAMWRNADEICGSPVDNDGNGYAGDCGGWNFYANTADVVGVDNAHGTNVAGAAGARAGNGEGSAGVAPDVTIMPLVVGNGESVNLPAGAQAIRYAADNGADVINASWGGNNSAAILQAAIDYANSKGAVVVAAAGNDAADRDTLPMYPASLSAPNLIKVGNSTAADTMSESSAYGEKSVDLFAPGKLVLVPWNDGGYRLVGGTSISAPQVAAAVALYKAHDRDATPAELKAQLLEDVVPISTFAGKSVSGGRLSLTALGNMDAPASYRFTGMTALAGTVTPGVTATGTAEAGAFAVRLGLGMEHGGRLLALTQQPIALGGVTATTDDAGEAEFSLGDRTGLGTVELAPSTELSEGRYVLTAQLYRNGSPLGLAYAAPLLVGEQYTAPDADTPTPSPVPGSGTPAPGGSTPAPGGSTPAPGGSTPAPGGSTPAPGGSTPAPGGSTPAPGGSTPAPGGSTPAPGGSTPAPGGSTPAPGDSTPAPGGSTPAPGGSTPGTSPTPDTDNGSGSQPGSPAPGGSTPAPGGSTPAPGGSSPDLGGEKTYPEVGPFGLTAISPTRVSVAGGERVTITGKAIPAGARVRVGTSAAATVVSVSSTSLVFTSPARTAGTYDVHVFAPDGTSSVLEGGLTYLASDGSAPAPGDGGQQPDSGSQPGGDTPGGSTPGSQPGGSGGSSDGSVTGPNGQRLMPSQRFAAISGSIWNMNCSSSCSGLAI